MWLEGEQRPRRQMALSISWVSGKKLFELSIDEIDAIVAAYGSQSLVRALKLYCKRKVGVSIYRQQLVRQGEVLEDGALDHIELPADLYLVLLPFQLPKASDAAELVAAARHNQIETLEKLLHLPIHPDVLDGMPMYALWAATSAGHQDVVARLLEAEAYVDQEIDAVTPLWVAMVHGHMKIIQLLIDHQADVNAPGITPLRPVTWAASGGNLEITEMLLLADADPNKEDNRGNSSLGLVCKTCTLLPSQRLLQVVNLLLRYGADPNTGGLTGLTPLMGACVRGRVRLARCLLNAKAEVNLHRALTPLMSAVLKNNCGLVKCLLAAGAKTSVKHNGTQPFRAAELRGHKSTAAVLLQAMNKRQVAALLRGKGRGKDGRRCRP